MPGQDGGPGRVGASSPSPSPQCPHPSLTLYLSPPTTPPTHLISLNVGPHGIREAFDFLIPLFAGNQEAVLFKECW